MSASTEKLLSSYKDYESLVRDTGRDPKEVEDQAPELEGQRLRMCRLFRNYLSHVNDPGFLEPTAKMTGFLARRVTELKMAGDVAKKHLKKPAVAVISDNMKLGEAVRQVLPLEREPVVCQTRSGYVIYGLFDLVKAALDSPKSTKVSAVTPKRVKPVFVRPDTPVAELDPDRVTICTDDGTEAGKLLGVVIL